MSKPLIVSDATLPWNPPHLHAALAGLLALAGAMGVVPAEQVFRIDAGAIQRLVAGLQRHGIAQDAHITLAPLLAEPAAVFDAATANRLVASVERIAEALEASAAPGVEWPALRAVFGDEMLGALVGVSPASLRRYSAAERITPDDVGQRLHWLALVVAHLAGAYNDYGIRRWFERPRTALGGKSPRQRLGARWSVDAAAARDVRALAAPLTGAQPLAA